MHATLLQKKSSMKNLFLIILIFVTSALYAQNKDVSGIYGEKITETFNPKGDYLELKSDSTFIYNYLGKKYYGNWELSQNKVLLNPKIKKQFPKIKMRESRITSDSITIKINYISSNENSDHSKNQDFRMATVYFDKKGRYINILKSPSIRQCGWAPIIRKQKILNNDNSVKISQKDFSQIGFMTYHLNDYIIFTRTSKDSNFFEFDIEDIQDDDDIIKDDFFLIDGKSLFYPNKKGNKNLIRLPLTKKKV